MRLIARAVALLELGLRGLLLCLSVNLHGLLLNLGCFNKWLLVGVAFFFYVRPSAGFPCREVACFQASSHECFLVFVECNVC